MKFENALSNGKWAKTVQTVGDLIEELKRLPAELPVDQKFEGRGSDLVIMNRDMPNAHIQLSGAGEWDED